MTEFLLSPLATHHINPQWSLSQLAQSLWAPTHHHSSFFTYSLLGYCCSLSSCTKETSTILGFNCDCIYMIGIFYLLVQKKTSPTLWFEVQHLQILWLYHILMSHPYEYSLVSIAFSVWNHPWRGLLPPLWRDSTEASYSEMSRSPPRAATTETHWDFFRATEEAGWWADFKRSHRSCSSVRQLECIRVSPDVHLHSGFLKTSCDGAATTAPGNLFLCVAVCAVLVWGSTCISLCIV